MSSEKPVCSSTWNNGLVQNWEKEYIKAVYCHPAYLRAEYIMLNARLDEAQAGIKIAWRNINNIRYVYDTTLMAESKED